jgi:hypothetical protein
VDSRFSFLSTAHADLLNGILTRGSSALLVRLQQANSVSRSDAEEIMSVISDEVSENLDDDWTRPITARLSVPCSRSSTLLASTSGPERRDAAPCHRHAASHSPGAQVPQH